MQNVGKFKVSLSEPGIAGDSLANAVRLVISQGDGQAIQTAYTQPELEFLDTSLCHTLYTECYMMHPATQKGAFDAAIPLSASPRICRLKPATWFACLVLAAGLWGCAMSNADSKPDARQQFGKFLEYWDSELADLLAEGLTMLVQSDELNGELGNFVNRLSAMPIQEEHLFDIAALIDKPGAHLQEAGIILATKAANTGRDYALTFESTVCARIKARPLDDWVLRALVQFAKDIYKPDYSERFICLYHEFARLAYGGVRYDDGCPPELGGFIMRNMAIQPLNDIRELIEHEMLQGPTTRMNVVLPFLEKEFGTQGFHATAMAIAKRRGLTEVYKETPPDR